MSEESKQDHTEEPKDEAPSPDHNPSDTEKASAENGPKFTEAPDPLAGVSEKASGIWDSMEGKTVSMRVYVGSIIGVIVLMLLARCGG